MQSFNLKPASPQAPAVYFGGTRNPHHAAKLARPILLTVQAVAAAGYRLHVGCQNGVDAQVIYSALCLNLHSFLFVFAVAPSFALAPAHVQEAANAGASVVYGAGGLSPVPVRARFLLRSLAAAQNTAAAFFWAPGAGSLSVMQKITSPVLLCNLRPDELPALPGRLPAVNTLFSGFYFSLSFLPSPML